MTWGTISLTRYGPKSVLVQAPFDHLGRNSKPFREIISNEGSRDLTHLLDGKTDISGCPDRLPILIAQRVRGDKHQGGESVCLPFQPAPILLVHLSLKTLPFVHRPEPVAQINASVENGMR